LDQPSIELHKDELTNDAGVLFDEALNFDTTSLPSGVTIFKIPLAKLVKEAGGSEIMRNTASLAATLALLDGNFEHLKDLISEEFAHKSEEIISLNHKVAKASFDYAKEKFADKIKKVLTQKENVVDQVVITANESCALGAVAAGLQFAAIYPMTPTTNILQVLAPLQEKFGFIYKQPEDEISALTMALGASHAGARSMVATSGGGFALMGEAYGLAGITETPVVIIEGMRGAPATGIPTWTEQGDLKMILGAHQGDFPRIVLAAGDAKEAFELTMTAFNLADKYQGPVVMIMDKIICEDNQSFPPFDYSDYVLDRGKYTREKEEDFQRYKFSEDGISTRTIVGSGNYFNANADEHDEYGYSSEDFDNRNMQMEKRNQKLATCAKEDMPEPILFGPEDAQVTLVSWGSNKGSILEALKVLPNVNFLHLTWINPFPVEAVKRILDRSKYVIDIECNFSAQMRGWIREQTGIKIEDTLLRYDGRPIFAEQIIEKVKKVMGEK
jgi:2-oxoglutarate ferredoxin oxidoreductase subunit alpha